MTKKEMAVSFLEMAALGRIREAYEKFVHPEFRHHNAYFKGDRESLLLAMEESEKNMPNKSMEVLHVFEEGDLVAVHSMIGLKDNGKIAAVHICRFAGELIIEIWDVAQMWPKDSPNENGIG